MRPFASARWLAVPAALVLAACPKATEPAKVPTTVTVTPGTVNLANLDLTQQLTAKVRDQNGDSLPSATVTWTSGSAAVATVSASGLVTATGAGTTTITATAGAATGQASVTVVVPPASIAKAAASGDGQTGVVTTALANPFVVIVKDLHGNPLAGVTVTFALTVGSGTLAPATATTGADGQASKTLTLGTTAGGRTVTASVPGLTAVTFTATGVAGPPANVAIQAGNNQSAGLGATVAISPAVRVTDASGNPTAGVGVTFAVATGGGSVTGATPTTNASGIATVGSWTLGAAGPNTLSATVTGAGITGNPATFTATAASVVLQVVAGDNQTGLVGYALNQRPIVRAVDLSNAPLAGITVAFAVTSGGGSVTGATVVTNAQGIAQVGNWILGGAVGANGLTATATGAAPANFAATGAAQAFNIVLNYQTSVPSAGAQAAFDSAAANWERVIFGDIPDFTSSITVNPGQCGVPASGSALTVSNIDDVMILVRFDSIDGPSNILGSAGPCFIRTGGGAGDRLTIVGQMRFDTADVASFVTSGRFGGVVLHEMGHVLGIGTLWSQTQFNCLQNPSASGNLVDTYYNCAGGLAAFDSLGGTNYTGGNKVPVENTGGSGTFNGHWRESVFDRELMTGYAEAVGVVTPLSLLTTRSLADLGYTVNYAGSDPYVQVFTLQGALRARAPGDFEYRDDIYRGPIYLVDRYGRIVGVTQSR